MLNFINDVDKGLSSKPKSLSSKYFYDEEGSKIFKAIMNLPEYYLTGCEYEILDTNKDNLLRIFCKNKQTFELIEFGAGDGLKTKILLKHFTKEGAEFSFVPVDISKSALQELEIELEKEIKGLHVEIENSEYFTALDKLKDDGKRKVVLFLGSNIGNFSFDEAVEFLSNLRNRLNKGDYLLIGFDLKKDPKLIIDAYNDKYGVTKKFNLNLLDRMNRELGSNFDTMQFDHFPTYDPSTGVTKSYIYSKKKQSVYIEKLNKTIDFDYAETIHTEMSQKYDEDMICAIRDASGFGSGESFYDCKHYFANKLWRV